MNLIDALSEITADLVEFEENEPFLVRLFQLMPGEWADLTCLVDGLDSAQQLQKTLHRAPQERVRATWLDYSGSSYGEGYSLIIFFAEEHQWHTIALYNKQRWAQAGAQASHPVLQLA